jgi:formyltetrahydrofolate deformylase
MNTNTGARRVLTLSCVDVPGIVHAIAAILLDHGANIVESQQFGDPDSGRFFMRVQFARTGSGTFNDATMHADLDAAAARFGLTWRLVDPDVQLRVVIMASKLVHCLNDLLFRISLGELHVDVTAVVSNHPDLEPLVTRHGIPFRYIPVSSETKPAAEAQLLTLLEQQQIDTVILARYMQVLSDDLCKRLEGRAINIHHSMLPSFKGARPYRQAHERGVKLIGATAHYVTADLDEGPIIEQDVTRVDHSKSEAELVAIGRDLECRALARAVRWHSENRVVLNGTRTVVFQ